MVKVLKELKGHSKSKVFLMQKDEKIFVRKIGNIGRNIERFDSLSNLNVNLPKIYDICGDSYDMEYISSLEMKNYLITHNPNKLIDFIREIVYTFGSKQIEIDFSNIYHKKISEFDFEKYKMPFTPDELFDKLPKVLPHTEYHGDFTLENILYDTKNDKFILIDPLTTEYSSFVFDLAKLNQDLICKWFIRNDNLYLDSKLLTIYENIKSFVNVDLKYLTILMLMRVIPYAENQNDKDFLMNEVTKLWK